MQTPSVSGCPARLCHAVRRGSGWQTCCCAMQGACAAPSPPPPVKLPPALPPLGGATAYTGDCTASCVPVPGTPDIAEGAAAGIRALSPALLSQEPDAATTLRLPAWDAGEGIGREEDAWSWAGAGSCGAGTCAPSAAGALPLSARPAWRAGLPGSGRSPGAPRALCSNESLLPEALPLCSSCQRLTACRYAERCSKAVSAVSHRQAGRRAPGADALAAAQVPPCLTVRRFACRGRARGRGRAARPGAGAGPAAGRAAHARRPRRALRLRRAARRARGGGRRAGGRRERAARAAGGAPGAAARCAGR